MATTSNGSAARQEADRNARTGPTPECPQTPGWPTPTGAFAGTADLSTSSNAHWSAQTHGRPVLATQAMGNPQEVASDPAPQESATSREDCYGNFVERALELSTLERISLPHSNIDPVLARFPPLAASRGLTVNKPGTPQVSCGRSALLLAQAFAQTLEKPTRRVNRADPHRELLPNIGDDLDVRTALQVVKRYAPKVPVAYYHGGTWPRCHFGKLYGKWEDNMYAVVYIGPEHISRGHWAFFRIFPSEALPWDIPEVERIYMRLPTIYFGSLPLIRSDDTPLWWKSYNLVDSIPELRLAMEEGWACICCFTVLCKHELAFMRAYPDCRRVSTFHQPLLIDGLPVGSIEQVFTHDVPERWWTPHEHNIAAGRAVDVPQGWAAPPLAYARKTGPCLPGQIHMSGRGRDYTLVPGPRNSLGVRNLRTGTHTVYEAHRNVRGFDRRMEAIVAPYLPSWFRDRLRLGLSLWERLWPCYHWVTELPIHGRTEYLRVGQFGLRSETYVNRTAWRYASDVAFVWLQNMAAAYLFRRTIPPLLRGLEALAGAGVRAAVHVLLAMAVTFHVSRLVPPPTPVTYFSWLPARWRPQASIWDQLPTLHTLLPSLSTPNLSQAGERSMAAVISAGQHIRRRLLENESWTGWLSRVGLIRPDSMLDISQYYIRALSQLKQVPTLETSTVDVTIVPFARLLAPVVRAEFAIRFGLATVCKTVEVLPAAAALAASAYTVWRTLKFLRYAREKMFVVPAFAEITWDHYADLTSSGHLAIPDIDSLLGRLRHKQEIDRATAATAVAVHLRRTEAFAIPVAQQTLDAWIERLQRSTGATTLPLPLPTNDHCWQCYARRPTKRHLCKSCRLNQRSWSPLPPLKVRTHRYTVEYTGFRPMGSLKVPHPQPRLKEEHYVIDEFTGDLLDPECACLHPPAAVPAISWRVRGENRITSASTSDPAYIDFWEEFQYMERATSVRGWAAGPIFQGFEPMCFPRGDATAAAAFLIRNLADRPHWCDHPNRAARTFWDIAFDLLAIHDYLAFIDLETPQLVYGVIPLRRETDAVWLDHFTDTKKRQEAVDALEAISNGAWVQYANWGKIKAVRFKGFTKSEKTVGDLFDEDFGYWSEKRPLKPRFICVPDTIVLTAMGPYTHRQMKWLTEAFPATSSLFYAGCATPCELRSWLNRSLERFPNPICVIDDISAMDANHNPDTHRFHDRVRRLQFPDLPADVAELFKACQYVDVRIGQFRGEVSHINPSGVSDTTYKNTLLAILIRWIALAHAHVDLFEFSELDRSRSMRWRPEYEGGIGLRVIRYYRSKFRMAATGDDGLTYMAADSHLGGVGSPEWVKRYVEVWNAAGFDIKVDVEYNFRLATFIANRPVWSDAGMYEWAPEPARRLKTMFWQFENDMHPIAWARGVAQQVVLMARHCPVLADICRWYLRRTSGPTVAEPKAFHQYNPMWANVALGQADERTINEFCSDYGIDRAEYDFFLRALDQIENPLVSISCHVFERILAMES